jgi:hypothetical protein
MATLASQIITAQFQGTLPIPIYQAPYTVPPNSGALFMMRCGAQNAYCDSSIFSPSESNPTVITQSRVTQLTLEFANVMTIGGGNNGQPNLGTTNWPVTNFENSLIAFLGNEFGSFGSETVAGTFSSVPIFNGVNFAPVGMSARGEVTWSYGGPPMGLFSLLQTGICLSGFLTENFISIGGVWCMVDITSTTLGLSNLAIGVVLPIVGLTIGAILPLFGLTNTQVLQLLGEPNVVPDYANASNTLISNSTLNGFTGLYGFYFNPLPGDLGATELLQFQTDNATINAAILGLDYILRPCANGWILSVGSMDYYVSADFTRYWQMQFVSAAPGIPLPFNGMEPGESSQNRLVTKFIDVQGIFWYTGINSNTGGSGGSNRPLYSFGFNLPFTPPVLPNVPPIKIPCWGPCSDMDSPFDSVYSD